MGKMAIVYWSGTGNTEAMANAIARGAAAAGMDADVLSVDQAQGVSLDAYDKLAFGCPSMGAEVLEEGEFDPYFEGIEDSLAGKNIALFGSYGWGDGEWMRNWVSRCEDKGASVYTGEGLIQNDAPDEAVCEDFGKGYAQA